MNISGAHQISKIFPNKLTFAVLSTREFPREKLDIKKFIKGVVVCVYASMYVCVYKHWVVIKSNFGNHPWDYYITSFHTSCIFSTRSSAVYRSILQYEREILNHILVCPQKWTHKNKLFEQYNFLSTLPVFWFFKWISNSSNSCLRKETPVAAAEQCRCQADISNASQHLHY